jgi:hypothetical protein
MAKLIVNPNQCAYQSSTMRVKKGETFVPVCTHIAIEGAMGCTNGRDFPDRCPLQDGVTMKDHLDSVLALKANKPNIQQVIGFDVLKRNKDIAFKNTLDTITEFSDGSGTNQLREDVEKRRQDDSEKSAETLKAVKRMQAKQCDHKWVAYRVGTTNEYTYHCCMCGAHDDHAFQGDPTAINIPVLSPIFWYCSYCKAWIFVKDQQEVDKHVSMVHGIPVNIPPCKLG